MKVIMPNQEPDGIMPINMQSHASMYLYLGMATGALTNPGAREHLIKSLAEGTVNRAYIEYLRDKLNWALEYSK